MEQYDVYSVLSEVDDWAQSSFETLMKVALGVAAADPRWTTEKLDVIQQDDQVKKKAFGAMSALTTDMARLDSSGTQLRSSLEELGIIQESKLNFAEKAFEAAKPALRIALGKTMGIALPRLIDMSWRLDYIVRGSDQTKASIPIYYLKLILAKAPSRLQDATLVENTVDTIDLALSVEQMEDFLHTIRDANHQATRIGRTAGGPPPSK